MSMAPRLTKCRTASTICAGQERFGQRTATSPSSRTTGESQAGQRAGMFQTGRASWAATLCSPAALPVRSPPRDVAGAA